MQPLQSNSRVATCQPPNQRSTLHPTGWPSMAFGLAGRVTVLLLAMLVCNANTQALSAELPRLEAFLADTIWPGNAEAIRDGAILVRDGKVVWIGKRDEAELDTASKITRLGGATIIPGLVVAETTLVESQRADEYALNPQVRSIDGFDAFEDYKRLLAGGVTTVQLSPGSDRLISGQGSVVKLAGDDAIAQILRESESLQIVLTQAALSPARIYEPPVGAVSVENPVEPTRPQLATSLAQAIVGLKGLFAEAELLAKAMGDDELATGEAVLTALAELRGQRTPVRFTVSRPAEIQAALSIASEFQLDWMLIEPEDTKLLTSKVDWSSTSAKGVILATGLRPGVIANPSVPEKASDASIPVWARARQLIDAGAGSKIAIKADSNADISKMLYLASVLGRGGLSEAQILRTVTSNPAEMLGVGDRVGSLKANADADFVVLSGSPFHSGTRVLSTFVDGKRVFEAETSSASVVVRAGTIYAPEGPVHDASVSVVGGKIGGVAADVSAPAGAVVRDFGDAVVVPGYLDLDTRLGISGSMGSVKLDTQLGEFLARDDRTIAFARQGGTTTVFLSNSQLPSPVVAFKLGDLPRVLKDPVALRFEIKGNLTASEASLERTLAGGKAYSDAWEKYEVAYAEYKKQLAAYESAKAKYDAAVAARKAEADKKAEAEAKEKSEAAKQSGKDGASSSERDSSSESGGSDGKDKPAAPEKPDDKAKESAAESPDSGDSKNSESKSEDAKLPEEPKKPTEPKKPASNSGLEPYRQLFARKLPALVEVSNANAVDIAVRLFRDKYDVKTAVVSGEAATQHAELLASKGVLVVVGPSLVGQDNDGNLENYAVKLALAGVQVAFQSGASSGVREFPTAISYAVHEGLGRSDALHAMTDEAAEFFGLDSVGKLAAGQDADLVVLSGPPLELSSEVLAVMIDGVWVYEKESK